MGGHTRLGRRGQDRGEVEKLPEGRVGQDRVAELDDAVVADEFGEADLVVHDEEGLLEGLGRGEGKGGGDYRVGFV